MNPQDAAKILSEVLNAATKQGVFNDLVSASVTHQALNVLINAATPQQAATNENLQ